MFFHGYIYVPSRLSTGEVVGREQVWHTQSPSEEIIKEAIAEAIGEYPEGTVEYWHEKPCSVLPSAGLKISQAIESAAYNKAAIKKVLADFLGSPAIESQELVYGDIPTDKLHISVEDHRITAIKWWSGLKWTARGGYGSPSVEVSL